MAQALIHYLPQQYVARDGQETPFFAGVWGIFGHGNVAGIGQALQQYQSEIRYYQSRNEQAQVHAAVAYAKHKNRLQTFACTASIGPGATNMLTGAALATINRIPVLLLSGDTFADRRTQPVLQQLESAATQDISVNDCFKPVSRYWDRIQRPDQLIASLPEAMRVLTSPAETGAVTLALPQDVQTEAYDYPIDLFARRVWTIPRARPDRSLLEKTARWIRDSKMPLIIAGGGVQYSEATDALRSFVNQTGIPVGETQAGKGSLPYNDPLNLGAIGATGTAGANLIAREADLIIGIGTRYSDFTTASRTAFQNPAVRFINLNVTELDAHKNSAIPLVGDARATLEELGSLLHGWQTDSAYQTRCRQFNAEWDQEVQRIYDDPHAPLLSQAEVIGMVNTFSQPEDVVVCAAGSLPGDLHKLWRTRSARGYHLEYGYSCMGYEIAGGMGVAMADPDHTVYVMVGDGSYLMMNTEIVTMVQEHLKVVIVLLDNHGFASIGALSKTVGSDGFGTKYRYRTDSAALDGDPLPIDYAQNCASLGAHVIEADSRESFMAALAESSRITGKPVCIVTHVDRHERVPGYESWWDVAIAEVSDNPDVVRARADYDDHKALERTFLRHE